MRANRLGKFKCRGRERANVIVSLVVRFSLTDTNALDTDQILQSHPIKVNATEVGEEPHNSTSNSPSYVLYISKALIWLSEFG